MLSWVTGLHPKSQSQPTLPSSLLEGAPQSGGGEDNADNEEQRTINMSSQTRRIGAGGLLPKLRRAFETATINSSSGSFPTASPEETVFEVASSCGDDFSASDMDNSYCMDQSAADMSCATGLSYNMSKIEDESIQEACDSISSPHAASETDSFFGSAFRDMVSFGDFCPEKKELPDDVWLLSTTADETNQGIQNNNNNSSSSNNEPNPDNVYKNEMLQEELQSPTGSVIRRKVPVIVLPGRTQSNTTTMKWDRGEIEEEEIDFGDCVQFVVPPISTTSASTITTQGDSKEEYGFGGLDESNTTGSIRNRAAHMIGNNIKGIWNSMDSRNKKSKEKGHHTRRSRLSKRKQPSSRHHPTNHHHQKDPLKELARCHDKMSENQRPFSPAKAFSRMRERKNRGEFLPDTMDGDGANFFLDCAMSKDEGSVLSALSTFSSATNALDAAQSNVNSDPSATMGDSDTGTGEGSFAASQKGIGFKFKSPRNDTPRIVWSEHNPTEEEEEEPRVLYTDEGDVAAIIYPKPKKSLSSSHRRRDDHGGFPEDPEESVFHHLFHSELSTLYEESSSLETSTFGTLSHSRSSSSAGEANASQHRNAPLTTHHQRPKPNAAITTSEASSVSSGSTGTNSKASQSENRPPPAKSPSAVATQHGNHVLGGKDGAGSNGNEKRGSFAGDSEMKMRWEISLGLMDNSDQWRQPMALMNTEELSNDYVAEI